jgi:hypothetical protein
MRERIAATGSSKLKERPQPQIPSASQKEAAHPGSGINSIHLGYLGTAIQGNIINTPKSGRLEGKT